MKRTIIYLLTLATILVSCSPMSSSAADIKPQTKQISQEQLATVLIKSGMVNNAMTKLKQRIGKTWYVFSGATPAGWDCSGLSMWFYEQLGIEIPHSANKQAKIGQEVKTPEIGDLVLFGYKGTNTFFHASIYAGDNKVIHAGFRKGQRTSWLDLTSPSVKDTKIRFVRVIY